MPPTYLHTELFVNVQTEMITTIIN